MAVLDVRPIFYVIGCLLLVLSVAMLAPLAVDLAIGHSDWQVFGVSSALSLFFGVLLMLTNRQADISLNLRQTFVLTTAAWVSVCLFCSLPFMFSEARLGFADAFFESMSGLTTTGGTVMTGLGNQPPGLLLWRSLLQWLGGIGIVVMGIVILPFLRVGGMQLFRSESSDKSDKAMPRATDLALGFGWIYLSLTVICAVLLVFAGMSVFDAVNHAMTAVATGGFSTQDASAAYWEEPAVHWILIVFMISGSLPFVRYITLVRGDAEPLLRDSQIRHFLILLVTISLALTAYLHVEAGLEVEQALRHASFNVVSIATTTGYALGDYTLWGPGPVTLFFLLFFIGGCTGSTTGSVKMFRYEILWLALRTQINRLFSPRRVLALTYNGKPVDSDVIISVMSFVFVFVGLLLILSVLMGLTGLDFVTSISGVATALNNVGPGLGSIIGPAGSFAPLEDEAKWVLSLAMLLGRLELFTVLVLFSPNFWRS